MKSHIAQFRFYEELNDFLPVDRRKVTFDHRFDVHPSVKDTIEGFGVPHTEVDLIVVNGQSVDFSYQLRSGDRVAVYPVFEAIDISPITHLRAKPLRNPRFILDVHLGKLARYLRLLGFDVLYQNNYSDETIIEIGVKETRTILTRDVGILKNKLVVRGYWIRRSDPKAQVREVLDRFDLDSQISEFTRCLECNGKIIPVSKQTVLKELPPRTQQYYQDFSKCNACGRVYWEGTHYSKMKAFIDGIRKK